MTNNTFDWGEELHNTVVKSLTTSFGLDFLLLNDQKGGDVDTIHNVRHQVYASETERHRYEQREAYDSTPYHQHKNYVDTNREGKQKKLAGELKDSYTGKTFKADEVTNLDHVIAAKEIHDDPGRILAGVSGVDTANHSSNLTHTNESINKAKKAKKMADFTETLREQHQHTQQEIAQLKSKLGLTEQEQKHLRKLENKANADFDAMIEKDKTARDRYNSTIETHYYTSSKFAKSVATASLNTGWRMGTREMLGLILAETWFEFRERIPVIYQSQRHNFKATEFMTELGDALRAVWERIRTKFHQFLIAFKDGAIGGILSSVTTTLLNIIFTTQKNLVRIIREMWNNLVQAFKLMVFNPDNLAPGALAKAVSKVIAAGIAVVTGVLVNESLSKIFSFPFGPELAAFCSAIVTGMLTLVMNYFLEHSELMNKIWAFLDGFKNKYQRALDYYQQVNAELDRYLSELSRIEFALNMDELEAFSQHLSQVNSEIHRAIILHDEIERRHISLPFESGNADSVRKWLNSL